MKTIKWLLALLLLILGGSYPAFGQQVVLGDEVTARLGEVLSGRSMDRGVVQRRGGREIFAKVVRSVPFVISARGVGSSLVFGVNPSDATALVVTNEHVVEQAFHDQRGFRYVMLLFYDPQLASEPFDQGRFRRCLASSSASSAWCEAYQRSLRPGIILGTDVARDLAVLLVPDIPKDISPILPGQLDDVQPGDEVAVIGHPLNLLWSFTNGIVSGIRRQFPTGKPPHVARTTVIQTQTPVNPGNSGGPLLDSKGRVVGVVFGMGVGERIRGPSHGGPGEEITIPAAGLNFAIAINEVQDFVSEWSQRIRKR
ncbi:MAG: serine protease [Deltaproteobacteria bacterium]|nr:serine protease [Deltaproteobacteria bacterium]